MQHRMIYHWIRPALVLDTSGPVLNTVMHQRSSSQNFVLLNSEMIDHLRSLTFQLLGPFIPPNLYRLMYPSFLDLMIIGGA
jgi:hypothetical protein